MNEYCTFELEQEEMDIIFYHDCSCVIIVKDRTLLFIFVDPSVKG